MGLSWASHSTLIYTSELILCSTICVYSATRHNIHLNPGIVRLRISDQKLAPTPRVLPGIFIIAFYWLLHMAVLSCAVIGRFRVPLCLSFKASLSAKPFLWKWLICMKMKLHAELIFIWKISHLYSFWNRGTGELGNGLLVEWISWNHSYAFDEYQIHKINTAVIDLNHVVADRPKGGINLYIAGARET